MPGREHHAQVENVVVVSDGGAPAGRPCAVMHTGRLTVTTSPPPRLGERIDVLSALAVRIFKHPCGLSRQ